MARSQKPNRRKRRKRDERTHGGWEVESIHYSDQTLGPGVESASPAEVFSAIQQLPPHLDWAAVESRVVPLFERVRPYPPEMPERAQAIVAPGVTIGFGLDFGPGFVAITPEMVERWSMSLADLAAHAVARLHVLAGQVKPAQVHRAPVGDVQVSVLQTELGIGSVLVLAPTELARLFGQEPRLFIAPMRDLLIGLPADVDPDFAAWLYEEIANRDPNCLYPRAFAFDGRAVTVMPLGPPLQHLLAG
jgi:hypothetical protein